MESDTVNIMDIDVRALLNTLHNLMLMYRDNMFVGVNETLIALRNKKAETISPYEYSYISVYDFRYT